MNARQLRARWTTQEGQQLARDVAAFMVGSQPAPTEVKHGPDGRMDLRGFTLRESSLSGSKAGNAGLLGQTAGSSPDIEEVHWTNLDLSFSRLPHLRLQESHIEGCSFEGADLQDWRLWNSSVTASSFRGSDMRGSALGTWVAGQRGNQWSRSDFERADLRRVVWLGGLIHQCSFNQVRLDGAQFMQSGVSSCTFSGEMTEVLFDGRELDGRPRPSPLVDVDFGAARFHDVEFRGCRFDRVTLPPSVTEIRNFPEVAARALELTSGDDSLNARMIRAELQVRLKLPGDRNSSSVFNETDYVDSNGESLATFARDVYQRAMADVAKQHHD